ncbi:MAG: class I SAM-dependent methyltransferase, partial [Methanomassiliicoccales archaeon]
NNFQHKGLEIKLLDYNRQKEDILKWGFDGIDIKNIDRKSIASSRTMLQHYLYLESQVHPGAVVWILDDDSRIDNLLYQTDSTVSKGNVEIITNIKRLKGYDIAIALGTVTGDPPLPFTSCIRTQLVDLYHNLEWMANLNPNKTFPNRCSENMECRSNYHDYYYDLSRDETDQLETPFWYVPEKDRIEVKTAFINMIEALPSIKQGRRVFRPIISKAYVNPMQQMIPSIHRGGNTFVFHISSLRDYPNIVPNIKGKDTRRSDMVWCLLNRYITGRKVIEVPIPVRQDRSYIAEEKLDFNKLMEDIQGYAVYSSLQDVFLEKVKERQLVGEKTYGDELLNFNSEDIELALYKFDKYLNERTLAFELSYLRIVGLLSQFKKYTDKKNKNKYWWLNNGLYENTCKILQEFIESLNNEYKEGSLIEFREKVENVNKKIIRSYFKQLKESVNRYKSNQPLITDEFIEFAENLIKNKFNVKVLKLLGYGEESIVFTDGQRVYKYFYHWKKLITPEQKLFISSLVEKLKGYKTLYPIAEVRTWREHFCIVYPYEESTEYKGGYLDDIYLFLKECKDAGIVYRNVHPNNFIVTNTGLKLIDYGSDIHPFSDEEYNKMIRRAYLMYLYHDRENLKDLMRKSIKTINLPEFEHFKHFQRAIEPRTKEEILDSAIVYMVENINPKSVLDYGCGKGKISEKLCQDGLEVQAFDIDDNVITNNKSRKGNVRYYGPNEISELINNDYKFDCIICNLVLCVIEEDDELRKILFNIRNKIREDGDRIITVCNPEDILIQKTEIQQRILPENANLEDKFIFKKNILSTGNVRIDIHRTIDIYQEEFERMGLIVNNIHKTDGSDVENLVSASDFVIFHLEVSK